MTFKCEQSCACFLLPVGAVDRQVGWSRRLRLVRRQFKHGGYRSGHPYFPQNLNSATEVLKSAVEQEK